MNVLRRSPEAAAKSGHRGRMKSSHTRRSPAVLSVESMGSRKKQEMIIGSRSLVELAVRHASQPMRQDLQ